MLGVLVFWRGHLHYCFELLWVIFHSMPGYDLTEKWTDVHLKWHLFLFCFKITFLHLSSTLHGGSSWSLPSASYPTTKMLSAIPNTLHKSLNISYIFLQNISPAGLLQMAISFICICQIGIKMLLGMMIVHLALGCDNENLHLYEKHIVHYLVLIKYYWVLVLCELVLWVLDLALSELCITWLDCWVLVPTLSYCTILLSHLHLVALWHFAVGAALTPCWMDFAGH